MSGKTGKGLPTETDTAFIRKDVSFTSDEFKEFDSNTIQGRTDAVRHILDAYGLDKDTDPKWMQHLMIAYDMLIKMGFIKSETREMTHEELLVFHAGTYTASTIAPALTSYISLLHPSFSGFESTLATDAHYRVAVGAWFFDPYVEPEHRGSMLVHEIMHGVLGHYDLKAVDPRVSNLAGDDVINQQIERSGNMELPYNPDRSDVLMFPRGIHTRKFPDGMDEGLSFWDYYNAQMEDSLPETGGDGSQQNNGRNGSDGDDGNPSASGYSSDEKDGSGNGGSSFDADAEDEGSESGDDGTGSGEDGEPDSGNEGGSSSYSGDGNDDGSPSGSGDGGSEDGEDGNGSGSGAASDEDNSDNGSGHGGDSENAEDDGDNGSGDGSDDEGVGDARTDGSKIGNINGRSNPCHNMTQEETDSLDGRGVQKTTKIERDMARHEALLQAMDVRKGRGTASTALNDFIISAIRPARVDWRKTLSSLISRNYTSIQAGNTDSSYRRPNRRRMDNSDGIVFPGTVGYSPVVVVGCDTSGSMSDADYSKALGEVDGILRQSCLPDISFVTVDTEITGMKMVRNVKDVNLRGGGGTIMKVFYDYINRMKRNRPDMTVLLTDGGIDWEDSVNSINPMITNLILVTDSGGYEEYKDLYGNKTIRGLRVLPIFNEKRVC